jgi:hypothetical protein
MLCLFLIDSLVLSAKMMPSKSVPQSSGAELVDRVIGIARSPLIPGEAEADYVGVAARIISVAQPRDAIEEFLTRDVIELTWDILRLRRMKAGLLRATVGDGVRRILSRIEDVDDDYDERRNADRYAQDWARGISQRAPGICGEC